MSEEMTHLRYFRTAHSAFGWALRYGFSDNLWVDFELYRAETGLLEMQEPREVVEEVPGEVGRQWQYPGTEQANEVTPEFPRAVPLLEGRIKWDGCSDWHFNDDIHFSGENAPLDLAVALTEVWRHLNEALAGEAVT